MNEAQKSILQQSVKPRRTVNGSGGGTTIPPSYGRTQGMKPAAFKALKGTLNQKVTGDVYARAKGKPRKDWLQEPVKKTPQQRKEEEPKLVETAKKRFQLAVDAESEIRKMALEDLKFRSGEQWPDGIKRQRETDGRPCLTINQIPQFIRQVTNEQRQNRPSIQVNPIDDEADPETAEIIQGIIRHIEYDSSADAAYDTAFEAAVTSGFGYWRVNTAYNGPMSFDQDIKILRIRNPFTVYMDPNAKEPDYSDANYGFVMETYSKDEYKAKYPKSDLAATADWKSIGDDWVQEETVRVVEYFYKETETKTICLLNDQSTVMKDYVPEKLPKGVSIVSERETQIDLIKWAKLNGVEVLEETDWAGRWIPIVPVLGQELDIDGKRVLEGIVRNAKEPQQQYNFMASASTEAIALSPKAPYVVAEGQIEGREHEWKTANVNNYAVLTYKGISIDGRPAPPPQRNTVEPAIQATTEAMMQASADLKAVTGIYQAALGAQGNETSGKGILARQSQSQGSNYHYVDNLTRALKHTGRIILDLIPKVYDTQRVMRIIGEDGAQSTATIGPSDPSMSPEEQAEAAGVERIYDITVGQYDVTISTGPSYQTKRQEAVVSMMQLVSAFPQLMAVAGDLLVLHMDWPGAKDIADRLKTVLPPAIQALDDKTRMAQLPPELQQQFAMLTHQNQQLTQTLEQATNDVKNQVTAKQAELESKERIHFASLSFDQEKLKLEYAKLQNALVVADIAAKAASAQSEMDREMEFIGQQIDNAHEYAMSQTEHEQAQQQTAQQGAQQSQLMQQQAQVQPAESSSGQ